MAVSEAGESLSCGPCDDAGEHVPEAWAEIPGVSEVSRERLTMAAPLPLVMLQEIAIGSPLWFVEIIQVICFSDF